VPDVVARAPGGAGAIEEVVMVGILWTVFVILLILWLLGFFVVHLGSLIHLLLVIAVIVLIYNLLAGRRSAV
jgi:hypothetical protein